MDGDHCVEEKMGCSGSVTRLDGASERESLLFEESREAGSKQRKSNLRQRRMSLWLQRELPKSPPTLRFHLRFAPADRSADKLTLVVKQPPRLPEFQCVEMSKAGMDIRSLHRN